MKPNWHTGPWTDEDTLDLRDELLAAQSYRSLTAEERAWLEAVAESDK